MQRQVVEKDLKPLVHRRDFVIDPACFGLFLGPFEECQRLRHGSGGQELRACAKEDGDLHADGPSDQQAARLLFRFSRQVRSPRSEGHSERRLPPS